MSAGFGPQSVEQLRQIARRILREEVGSGGLGGAGSQSTGLSQYILNTKTNITARSSNTPGMGMAHIQFRSTASSIVNFSTVETVTLFNLSTSEIEPGKRVQASQDIFGSLWVDKLVPPAGAGHGCSTYTASDGSEYSDVFTSSTGWTANGPLDTLKISAGHMIYERDQFSVVTPYAYRTRSITGTLDQLRMDCLIYETTGSNLTGIFWYLSGTPLYQWALAARWDLNNYIVYEDGDFVDLLSETNPNPADGDKLTLDLSYDGTHTRGCFFVNETLVHGVKLLGDKISSGNTERYGLLCDEEAGLFGNQDIGEWDTFDLQLDITT